MTFQKEKNTWTELWDEDSLLCYSVRFRFKTKARKRVCNMTWRTSFGKTTIIRTCVRINFHVRYRPRSWPRVVWQVPKYGFSGSSYSGEFVYQFEFVSPARNMDLCRTFDQFVSLTQDCGEQRRIWPQINYCHNWRKLALSDWKTILFAVAMKGFNYFDIFRRKWNSLYLDTRNHPSHSEEKMFYFR